MLNNFILLGIVDNLEYTFYGVSSDTIFTIFITIFIFIIGILSSIFINYRKEKNRLNHIENYFLKGLNKFLEPVENQVNSYKELSEAIYDITSRNYSFNIQIDLLFDTITNIDKLDLFKIFVSSKKRKDEAISISHYSNIIGSIEFVKNQIELARINFNKFFSDIRRYEKQWSDGLNDILRKWDIYLSYNQRNGISPPDDLFLKEFDLQLQKLKDEKVISTIKTIKSKFLDTLKQICIEKSEDSRAVELLSIIANINESYTNILNAKIFYSKAFIEDSEALNERLKLISDAIKYFETT